MSSIDAMRAATIDDFLRLLVEAKQQRRPMQWRCRHCGTSYVVPSLARECEARCKTLGR